MSTSVTHWISVLILISIFKLSHSAIYYVDSATSNLRGDGSSWDDAFLDLSDALNIASIGDAIWLKGNRTYIPNLSDQRDDCFVVNDGVSIHGGFIGTETSLDDRISIHTTNAQLYESIISGNIGDPFDDLDNCYHVLTYNISIYLDRVTISDGFADFRFHSPENRSLLHGYGAALITDNGLTQSIVNIQDVVFENNIAINGGALWFGSSTINYVNVQIIRSRFRNNSAIHGIDKLILLCLLSL